MEVFEKHIQLIKDQNYDFIHSKEFIEKFNVAKKQKKILPSKVCVVCERPFNWRKKWAKNWDYVKYCSTRCASYSRNKRKICSL